jgi:hypothetical protein
MLNDVVEQFDALPVQVRKLYTQYQPEVPNKPHAMRFAGSKFYYGCNLHLEYKSQIEAFVWQFNYPFHISDFHLLVMRGREVAPHIDQARACCINVPIRDGGANTVFHPIGMGKGYNEVMRNAVGEAVLINTKVLHEVTDIDPPRIVASIGTTVGYNAVRQELLYGSRGIANDMPSGIRRILYGEP